MLKLLKIAVTGNVAVGKTTVCKYFKDLKSFVVNTDKIAHDLLFSKTSFKTKLLKVFGNTILSKNKISIEKLKKEVFEDEEKLQKLERLIHPKIFKEVENLYKKIKKEKKYLFFVVEIPLLFETKKEKFFDYIITVVASKKNCKTRFLKKYFEKRMKRQLPDFEKIKKSDFVIKNNSTLANLKKETKKITDKLYKNIKEN